MRPPGRTPRPPSPGELLTPPYARPDGSGGGPISAQHRWLQSRIARICELLGYEAIPEHYETHADVYVPARGLALEVQRWSTNYETRTRARLEAGADPLWLLPIQEGDPQSSRSTRALFALPAARIFLHAQGDRRKLLTPWLDPTQRANARLTVFGTVARLNRDGYRPSDGQLRLHDFPQGSPGKSW